MHLHVERFLHFIALGFKHTVQKILAHGWPVHVIQMYFSMVEWATATDGLRHKLLFDRISGVPMIRMLTGHRYKVDLNIYWSEREPFEGSQAYHGIFKDAAGKITRSGLSLMSKYAIYTSTAPFPHARACKGAGLWEFPIRCLHQD